MSTRRVRVIETPVGLVELTAEGGALTSLRLGVAGRAGGEADQVLDKAEEELRLYFAGTLQEFTVPLALPAEATPYARRVWAAMAAIPYGETLTYGELARKAGGSPRSVGGACRANRIPIIIPCHRVVAASGLGGYSGDWGKGRALSVKKVLLELEKGR